MKARIEEEGKSRHEAEEAAEKETAFLEAKEDFKAKGNAERELCEKKAAEKIEREAIEKAFYNADEVAKKGKEQTAKEAKEKVCQEAEITANRKKERRKNNLFEAKEKIDKFCQGIIAKCEGGGGW
eukprot:CAMPEP_0194349766 /NCGR_PEP_ID=MMETSP0171-20130528/107273_1 /TAXON_ID=218684 /ORGANISM="Corethron pennatum, Strain L29A3" /LENGTH=125 /DNA_ID=CAMNT_0039117257 /DNA_START=956 /DNA_END=1330 /DNA_ORIENTATION=+